MRIRFRLRWTLIAVTIVALGLGAVMSRVRRADEQRRFCQLVRIHGGQLDFRYSLFDVELVETASASDGRAEGFITRRLIHHFGEDGWGTLESLYLGPDTDNDATHEILSAAFDYPSIATVVFDGQAVSGDTIEQLNQLASLRQLVLRRCIVNESVLGLLRAPNLQHLLIEAIDASQWSWALFNQFPQLISVDIVLGRINASKLATALRRRPMDRLLLNDVDADGELSTIFHIPCVSLSVYDMPVTDDDLSAIGANKRLRRLALQETDVTDQSIDAIVGLTLVHLDLSNTSISDASIAKITKLSTLQSLELEGTRITDEGLAMIAQMQGLRSLTYSTGTGVTSQGHNQFGSLAPAFKIHSIRNGIVQWIVRTDQN